MCVGFFCCLLFSSALPLPWQSSSRSPPPLLLLCTHCYYPPPAPLAMESFLLHLSCSSLLGDAGFSLPNLISFHANSLSLLPCRSNNNNNRRILGELPELPALFLCLILDLRLNFVLFCSVFSLPIAIFPLESLRISLSLSLSLSLSHTHTHTHIIFFLYVFFHHPRKEIERERDSPPDVPGIVVSTVVHTKFLAAFFLTRRC